MTHPTGTNAQTGPDDVEKIVRALAEAYRRKGYHQVAFPASALLTVTGTREALEAALAALLDGGGVVPVGSNGVALHPGARMALLNRAVLDGWLIKIAREKEPLVSLYRDGIATELATLVAFAANSGSLPDDLTQRAAELAGVLATQGLEPRAFDIVGTHGGTPRSRLAALAAVRQQTIPVERLREHLRNTVSSAYPSR